MTFAAMMTLPTSAALPRLLELVRDRRRYDPTVLFPAPDDANEAMKEAARLLETSDEQYGEQFVFDAATGKYTHQSRTARLDEIAVFLLQQLAA